MAYLEFNWDGRKIVRVDSDTFDLVQLMLKDKETPKEIVESLMATGMESWRAMEILVLARRELELSEMGQEQR